MKRLLQNEKWQSYCNMQIVGTYKIDHAARVIEIAPIQKNTMERGL
jgi:hypothetical protein